MSSKASKQPGGRDVRTENEEKPTMAWAGGQGILTSLIDENDAAPQAILPPEASAEIFLLTFSKICDKYFLPSPRHFQVLLYLCINPPSAIDPYFPISILHTLKSYYSDVEIAGLIPRVATTRKEREDPPWLSDWQHKREDERGTLDTQVYGYMKGCVDEGIWGLLWDKPILQPAHLSLADRDEEDDDEEEEEGRKLKETGWDLLDWLLTLWESDEEQNKSRGYSELFLDQLPPPLNSGRLKPGATSQRTSIGSVLTVLRATFTSDASPSPQDPSKILIGRRLITLLLHCTLGLSPPLSPATLLLSLLSLIRNLNPSSTESFIQSIECLSWIFKVHLYTLAIEDLAGLRTTKTAARKLNPKLDFGDVPPTESAYAAYPNPKQSYVQGELSSIGKSGQEREKVGLFKQALLNEFEIHQNEWK